ncbi:MAG: hypothetical protein HY820_19165 [Acidobacteria bacterium]|nr:hypothetical protein [Acidobacteriota bacterium]
MMAPVLVLLAGFATHAGAQPSITNDGLRNSASLFPPRGFLTAGLAQGGRFVILGSGFLPTGTQPIQAEGYPLPTELNGISVQFSGQGSTEKAFLLAVTATRVEGILPSSFPTGNAALRLILGKDFVDNPVFIASQKFGIYTANGRGSGPAVAYQGQGPDAVRNSFLAPAKPGQTVAIMGTGLGARKGSDGDTPAQESIQSLIRVVVGGRRAEVLYKGRSERGPGLDEIQFVVPADVDGCYVPIVVEADGVRITTAQIMDEGPFSNYATISVAAGDRCSDPTGISAEDLDLLTRNGNLRVGGISLARTSNFDPRIEYTDNASASFVSHDAVSLLRSAGIFGLPMPGSCYANPGRKLDSEDSPPPLDAGSSLMLNSSSGARPVPRQDNGGYANKLGTGFLSAGSLSVSNDNGGADVGPFQVTLNIMEPVQWTNKAVRAIDTEPTRWSGGDPDSLVIISEIGSNNFATNSAVCVERASAGSFAVPTSTYRTLGERGNFGSYPAVVSVGSLSGFARFTAPGLDAGFVSVILNESLYIP